MPALCLHWAGDSGHSACIAKNPQDKALIPLPPTGFTSVLCKGQAGAISGAAQARWGGVGRMAISQSAKFCEGVQPGFKTNSKDAGGQGMGTPKVY